MNAVPFSLHRGTEEPSEHPADIVGNSIGDALAILKLVFIAADGEPISKDHPDHFKCLGVVLDALQRADTAMDNLLSSYELKKIGREK